MIMEVIIILIMLEFFFFCSAEGSRSGPLGGSKINVHLTLPWVKYPLLKYNRHRKQDQ